MWIRSINWRCRFWLPTGSTCYPLWFWSSFFWLPLSFFWILKYGFGTVCFPLLFSACCGWLPANSSACTSVTSLKSVCYMGLWARWFLFSCGFFIQHSHCYFLSNCCTIFITGIIITGSGRRQSAERMECIADQLPCNPFSFQTFALCARPHELIATPSDQLKFYRWFSDNSDYFTLLIFETFNTGTWVERYKLTPSQNSMEG